MVLAMRLMYFLPLVLLFLGHMSCEASARGVARGGAGHAAGTEKLNVGIEIDEGLSSSDVIPFEGPSHAAKATAADPYYQVQVGLSRLLNEAPRVADPLAQLPQCPYSRWQGNPRHCYNCRWCPFRSRSCCEAEDEINILRSINISGSKDWDCFITIVHYQQCGRCSPDAKDLVQHITDEGGRADGPPHRHLNYVWDPRNLSIRPCRRACQYIYRRCKKARLFDERPAIPQDVSEEEFCGAYPIESTPELPCYDGAAQWQTMAALAIALLLWLALP